MGRILLSFNWPGKSPGAVAASQKFSECAVCAGRRRIQDRRTGGVPFQAVAPQEGGGEIAMRCGCYVLAIRAAWPTIGPGPPFVQSACNPEAVDE